MVHLYLPEVIMSDAASSVEPLSKREAEVAAAYADGASYKVIARDLGISPTTVRSHLRTVYGKLNVTSKIALAQALADPHAPSDVASDTSGLLADLALELDEAMRRERAMTRVLRIVNESSGNLDDVIDEVLEQALEICEAEFGILMEHHGDFTFTEMRSSNISVPFSDWLSAQGAFNPGADTAVGRAARTLKPVSIADVSAEDVAYDDNPLRFATVTYGRARSLAAIPMTAGGRLIGVFSVYRTRVHPFNDRSLELAQAFADQAAIAIKNSQHIKDMEARLDRAAATHEILEAISNTSDDETPVFDAILGNARKLCDAPFAALILARPGDEIQAMIAHHGALKSTEDYYAEGRVPMDPDKSFAARAITEKRPVHLHNMMDTDQYRAGVPNVVELCDVQGIRTNLFVPLVRDGEGIGCFVIFRHEVRPYSDEQIALVETFATQAVIALENVRQFRALQARTREVQELNASLEAKVDEQIVEIERMGRLKRFLPPAVADRVVSSGSETMLQSHRALLGVLFCDIQGFTAFCETAEPEETIEVLQTYHEEMGKLINLHGAGVDLRMGNGIMVLFNDPIPCDDPAGDAVRLAIAMRARMGELCAGWKRLGHRLGFGVGVSLGYATVGLVGSEGRFDYTASGTAINLASRLCDAADDGEILLSTRAGIAVEDDFDIESRGELNLTGMREPIEVFRLVHDAV
ncbi:GAF domain-containing protein [uncultured Tateyamaria sp.]|uniref:GAF domain-containing protein n=1 Tax=uncultured Tateyamaria sp. TaxID=455651 RepID=UPI00262911DA|nr:GAF domain-containing protein [uncultured Tateyamaria sp.]